MISKEDMRILYELALQDVDKEINCNRGGLTETFWHSLQEIYKVEPQVAQAALAMIILCTSVDKAALPDGLLSFLLSAHPEVKT